MNSRSGGVVDLWRKPVRAHRVAAVALAMASALAMPWARAAEGAAKAPNGIWAGSCDLDGRTVFLRVMLRDRTGAAVVRALGIRRAELEEVAVDGARCAFAFRTPGGLARLSGTLCGDTLGGTVESAGTSGSFALRRRYPITDEEFDPLIGDYRLDSDRILFVGRWDDPGYTFLAEGDRRIEIVPVGAREFLADDLRTIAFDGNDGGTIAVVQRPGEMAERAPRVRLYDEERLTFDNGTVRLAGALVLPPGDGPHPALVFVHGSGPQTRESYRLDADLFARGGVACLFYDKRGTGQSSGDWQAADFDTLADDVLAGVRLLAAHPRIRRDKIGLWGVSQAGWIIPLAASRSGDVAFIVPVSGGAVMPAEQEAWRRRQNLLFLGVDERFIEAGRKASVMAFDWQRRHQLGLTPIPNPFADQELNMYHDAPGVLRKVRQPALAIFGGLDTITPPRESAAVWVDALSQRGDDDFSVRFFPQGTHGIYVGEKTGSPFEMIREPRFVPGYIDTILAWIHHHAGGPQFAAARQRDADGANIPVESRGLDRLSWFGSGAVQPWMLLVSLLVFSAALLAWPLGWLWRKARRTADARPLEVRSATRWAALVGLLDVLILLALVYVLYMIADAEPVPLYDWLPTVWNLLVAATWASLAASALLAWRYHGAWRKKAWSAPGAVFYALVTLTAAAWVPFVVYWDLLVPAW